MLAAVTTPATAQITNPVFLDCDVGVTLRESTTDDRKEPSEKMYYKIDVQNSELSKFDVGVVADLKRVGADMEQQPGLCCAGGRFRLFYLPADRPP